MTVLVCSVTAVGAPPADSTEVAGCTTIDEPGRYVLTEDIQAPRGTDVCVRVRASDVVFDGDGHRLAAGHDGAVGVGVGSRTGASNVSVSDLTVVGWGVGVGYGNVDGGTIEGVEAERNSDGVRLVRTRNVHVVDAVVGYSDRAGVVLSHRSRDNAIVDVETWGNRRGVRIEQSSDNTVVDGHFRLDHEAAVSLSAADGTTLRGNLVRDSYHEGVEVRRSNGTRLVDTRVWDVDGVGIRLDGSQKVVVDGADVLDSGRHGVELTAGTTRTRLTDVLVTESGRVGLHLQSAPTNTLRDVTASRNGEGGIVLADSADVRLDRATTRRNGGVGVAVRDSNRTTVQESSVTHSRGTGLEIRAARETMVSGVTANDNWQHGVSVVGGRNTTLRGVTAEGNDVGVRVASSPGTVVAGTTSRSNGVDGVHVTAGSHRSELRGVTASHNAGSGVQVVGSDRVRIADTTANRNADDGVELTRSDHALVRTSSTDDNGAYGLAVSEGVDDRVTNHTAAGNAGPGIRLFLVDDWYVADSVSVDNGDGNGLTVLEGNGTATGNRFIENRHGVFVSGTNYTFSNNEVRRNRKDGFAVRTSAPLGHTEFEDNTVVGNGEHGIAIYSGTGQGVDVVSNNTISGNGVANADTVSRYAGVLVRTHNTRIRGNDITDNDGDGVLLLGDENTVRDNLIAGNTRAGVQLEATRDVVVAGNRLRRNFYGVHIDTVRDRDRYEEIVRVADETTVADNVIADNRRTNVYVVGARDTDVLNNTIVGSEVGVETRPAWYLAISVRREATGLEIHRNHIADNRDYGVTHAGEAAVDARRNYWGASDGPSSPTDPDAPFVDPTTAALANGSGDAVSEGPRAGVSNVRFDPYWRNASRAGPIDRTDQVVGPVAPVARIDTHHGTDADGGDTGGRRWSGNAVRAGGEPTS